jgi:hypothetical protein
MEIENINKFEENPTTTVEEIPKELKPKTKRVRNPIKKTKEGPEITYNNFIKNIIKLTSFKLPELKAALKNHNLKISGKKEILVERLETHFNHTFCAQRIQKVFRSWLVRNFINLKGPALRNTLICVNDKDFVTMEPLIEIKKENFYSYKDSKEFVYGFDIASLIHVIKSNSKLQNPYNREKISQAMIDQIKKVYRLSFIIYPDFKNEHEPLHTHSSNSRPIRHASISRNQHNVHNNNNINNNHLSNEMISNNNRLTGSRNKPLADRINDLFIEIDSLGNYTQSSWFNNLDIRNYIRLYRSLYDIWNFRSNMSRDVQNQICPLRSPFDGIFPRVIYHDDLTLEQIKNACVTVFENMIYLGINEDSRRLGAFHALSALTIVSPGARQSLPWLYDSVVY